MIADAATCSHAVSFLRQPLDLRHVVMVTLFDQNGERHSFSHPSRKKKKKNPCIFSVHSLWSYAVMVTHKLGVGLKRRALMAHTWLEQIASDNLVHPFLVNGDGRVKVALIEHKENCLTLCNFLFIFSRPGVHPVLQGQVGETIAAAYGPAAS